MEENAIKKEKTTRRAVSQGEKTPDRRVKRTKAAIRNAFVKLLSEKDINEITVKELAEAADVNRKTFYTYYKGVYQVADDIEEDVVNTITGAIGSIDFGKGFENPDLFFQAWTKVFMSDEDFYGYLLHSKGYSNLGAKITDRLKEKAKEAVLQRLDVDEGVLTVVVDYVMSGIVTAYQMWFRAERKIPIEELSRCVTALTFFGLSGLYVNEE